MFSSFRNIFISLGHTNFITCDSLLYVAVLNIVTILSRFRSFIHSSDLFSITCWSLKVILIYFRFTLYFLIVFPLILLFRSSQPYIKKYLSSAHNFQIIRQTVYFYLSHPSYYFKYIAAASAAVIFCTM